MGKKERTEAGKPCQLWSWVSPACCCLEPIRRGRSENKLMATDSVSLGLILECLASQEKSASGYQLKPLRGHTEPDGAQLQLLSPGHQVWTYR